MPLALAEPVPRRHAPLREHRPAAFAAPLFAGLVALAGLINVISAVTPELADRMHDMRMLAPAAEIVLARQLALPVGIALLLAAPYLALRRRGALWAAVGLLLSIGVLDLVKGLDFEEAAVSFAVAAALVRWRAAFWVRHDVGHAAIALRRVGTVALAALGTGVALRFAGVPWGAEEVLSAAPFAVVLWIAFRRPEAPGTDECRSEVAGVIRAHGEDTLSFFKLRGDLDHVFSPSRRAVLSYRVEGGVLLIAGDPVGPTDEIPALLRATCAVAEASGLRIGVVGASGGFAHLCAEAGLRSMYIGDEAVVETAGFTLEGKKIKKVRQAVMRVERNGYTVEMQRHGALSPAELTELERVSACWRDGSPERGFSMALDSLHLDHLEDTWIVIARDGAGVARGFLHYVPTYGRPAASLSFMRREHDTPNGVIDFLVVRSIELLRAEGIEEISLNFAAFARLLRDPGSVVERLLAWVVTLANPFFQIESLYRFNRKFQPRWEPRYLCYEGRMGLVRAGVAALMAEGQMPLVAPRQPDTVAA